MLETPSPAIRRLFVEKTCAQRATMMKGSSRQSRLKLIIEPERASGTMTD
jgi:hypothetical protein